MSCVSVSSSMYRKLRYVTDKKNNIRQRSPNVRYDRYRASLSFHELNRLRYACSGRNNSRS